MRRKHDTKNRQYLLELPRYLREIISSPIDVKLYLLDHYAELARMLSREILDEEVAYLTGRRYSRTRPFGGRYHRWGTNPGSVRLGQERVPIEVPRIRDRIDEKEKPLESYQAMKQGMTIPETADDTLSQSILKGLSTHDYGEVARHFVDGFGLSQSSISRAFIERSRQALESFERRSLADEDFIALWIDGEYLAKQQMVICLGLTFDGRKVPLGFIQTTTENAEAIKGLLDNLIIRGLDYEKGLLVVIDGAKGLTSAVRKVFGEYAVIHRCQWHKRENVVSYLNKSQQDTYRQRMQRAYGKSGLYEDAKKALMEIHAELCRVNRSAANSLMEGMEETLTLHRLGVFEELGKSLKTTNCIENLNSQLVKYLGRVKRWMYTGSYENGA